MTTIFDKRCPKCNRPVSGTQEVTSLPSSYSDVATCQHCKAVVRLNFETTDLGPEAYYETVPEEVVEAVRRFALAQGRNWRAKLRGIWRRGLDAGNIRNARNMIGPSGLDKIFKG